MQPAEAVTASTRDADDDWPNPVFAWYVVGVLMLAYTNSFIDRQILSLLIEPIKRDLAITDTQVSLLAGLGFSIFYTLMGVPIARLADQHIRKVIVATGVAVWSAMTALCVPGPGAALCLTISRLPGQRRRAVRPLTFPRDGLHLIPDT